MTPLFPPVLLPECERVSVAPGVGLFLVGRC